MARALVIFASEEGQTARIARRVAEELHRAGVEVALRDLARHGTEARLAGYDGVVIGASVHFGHHDKAVARLVKEHLAILHTRHTAFFSVSLSAGGPSRDAAAARRYLEEFAAATGWKADLAASFAGAVRHSRYGFLRTLLVHLSLRRSGAPESGDHEYTDWAAVTSFAEAFARRLQAPKRALP